MYRISARDILREMFHEDAEAIAVWSVARGDDIVRLFPFAMKAHRRSRLR